jgi:hypothetical protein
MITNATHDHQDDAVNKGRGNQVEVHSHFPLLLITKH